MSVIGGTASMYIIAFFLPSFLTLALGVSSAVSLLLLLPAFHLILTWPSTGTVLVLVFVLIGLMTLQSPVGFGMILEALRPEVRATSLGIIYAFGPLTSQLNATAAKRRRQIRCSVWPRFAVATHWTADDRLQDR